MVLRVRVSLGIFLLLGLMTLLGVLTVSAGSDGGATFALDCQGFAGTGGSIYLNRDNTGSGREAFVTSATDGAGNVIYEPVQDIFFVGGSVSYAGTDKIEWTTAPQYNPLTVRIASRSGNGFSEQLIVLGSGGCEGLPTFSNDLPEGIFFINDELQLVADGFAIFPAGITSPPVALNADAPRPTNDEDLTALLRGVAIVNTDNLYLRTGDGPQYEPVAIVDGGAELVVLGRNLDFSWWYVQAGDVVGWARASLLIMRGNFIGVPVVPSNGILIQPRLFVFSDQPIFGTTNIYSAPLCTIPGNLEYVVEGRNQAITWYEISAECDGVIVKGWIEADKGAIRNEAALFIPVTT